MDSFFNFSQKKNKTGEVTVATLKKCGIKTLNVSGKLKVPKTTKNLSSLQSIINNGGDYFLGLFPFLKKERNKHIYTYSLTEKSNNKQPLSFNYDYTFILSAVDMPADKIALTVLNRIGLLADTLQNSINEEVSACTIPDHSQELSP